MCGDPSASRLEGTRIGPYELLIGGQAQARKLGLPRMMSACHCLSFFDQPIEQGLSGSA
jgi:hypothetical protein